MNRPKEKVPPRPKEKSNHTGIHKILDDTATSTYQDVIAIIEAKIELVKIELTEKISVVSAVVILGVILIIGIAYLITTFALLTGELLGHPFLGYLIVSLIFSFMLCVLHETQTLASEGPAPKNFLIGQ